MKNGLTYVNSLDAYGTAYESPLPEPSSAASTT